VVDQSQFATQTERYDGVDAILSARFGKGGFIQGGASFGRQVTDNCYQNSRPDLTAQPPPGLSIATNPRSDAYCHVSPPWSAGSEVKAAAVETWHAKAPARTRRTSFLPCCSRSAFCDIVSIGRSSLAPRGSLPRRKHDDPDVDLSEV